MPLKMKRLYHFVSGGDTFGSVPENTLIRQQIMLIPNAKGIVTYIAPKGMYTVTETVLEIEFEGKKSKHSMMQVSLIIKTQCLHLHASPKSE